MNNSPVLVMAVALIGFAMVGLIAMLVYAQIQINRTLPKKRVEPNIVAVHRFKSQRRHRAKRSTAIDAPSMPIIPTPDQPRETGDDSRWQRPGFAVPSRATNERSPLPYYEPHKPRHVLIMNTPTVIVPHETVDPPKTGPRLIPPTRRNQPTAIIKAVRLDRVPEQGAQKPNQGKPARGRMDPSI
jgi:hypothetical protein